MSNRIAKKAPIVRLPPKSNVELLLLRSAQVAVIVMGLVTAVFALHAGEYILAPASLGIVLGLMLGPVATKLERRGLRPGVSASLVVILFILAICLFAVAVADAAVVLAVAPAAALVGPAAAADGTQGAAGGAEERARPTARADRRRRPDRVGGRGRRRRKHGHPGAGSRRADPDLLRLPLFFRRHPQPDPFRHSQALPRPAPALARRAYFPRRRKHGVALPALHHRHKPRRGLCGRHRPPSHRRPVGSTLGGAGGAHQFRRLHRPDRHGGDPVHGRARRVRLRSARACCRWRSILAST